jgi:hypothetical protein
VALTDSLPPALDRKKWTSTAYDHYNVEVERHVDSHGQPHQIFYKFICRFDPLTHGKHLRARMATGHGTQNLKRGADTCNKRRGVTDGSSSHAGAQQTLSRTVSTYTPSRHRALIAMRCAASKRPFQSVEDAYYLEEVEMLRPGTVVPSRSTVSRDINAIFRQGSVHVKDYFEVQYSHFNLLINS